MQYPEIEKLLDLLHEKIGYGHSFQIKNNIYFFPVSKHFVEYDNGEQTSWTGGIRLSSVIFTIGYDNLKFKLEEILLELI